MQTSSDGDVQAMVAARGDAKARQVNAMFARISGQYDVMNTLMTGGMHYVWRAMAARIATENRPRYVLDVATGTGALALAMARRDGVDLVAAADFVEAMVRLAVAKARPGRRDNLRFVVGDALRLPFPDGVFGAVTVGWGVRNFGDLDAGLREMARVLYPGGRMVIVENTPLDDRSLRGRALGLYANRLVPMIGALATRDRAAYTYLPQSIEAFLPAEALADRMRAAGLVNVGYRRTGFGAVAIHWGDTPPI